MSFTLVSFSAGVPNVQAMDWYLCQISGSTRLEVNTILKRLEEAGMLVVRSTEFEGRLRKYYHITNIGLKRIEDFKNEWKELMDIYAFIDKEEYYKL